MDQMNDINYEWDLSKEEVVATATSEVETKVDDFSFEVKNTQKK